MTGVPILKNTKMQKHFELTIEDNSFSYRRLDEQIAQEASLDGMYVVRTSLLPETLTGLPASERPRSGARRTSRPPRARFDAWSAMGGATCEMDFVERRNRWISNPEHDARKRRRKPVFC